MTLEDEGNAQRSNEWFGLEEFVEMGINERFEEAQGKQDTNHVDGR